MASRWDVGDPDVDAFVDANVVSFAAWDLVIYLNSNPHVSETVPSLCVVLGRQEHDLVPALTRLVDNAVLLEDGIDPEAGVRYRLCDDGETRQVIARFVTLAGKREHRLEFVRRVLARLTGA
ncbi:MAG: hypothetical protein Q7W30_04210 [Coriobacteriia bacterium]|nr:hypothetical protein [Coriobacteriia bacterium]